MPTTQADVLTFVQQNGPCVPNTIRQALKAQDNFVVGAILSELVAAGKLAMSDVTLGTSRFYYDPQQPQQLEKAGPHLNEKDVRSFQLLKDALVLKNDELTPLQRVSMANIKDFSRILKIRTDTGEELFWHYYLLTPEEAFAVAKKKYFGEVEKPAEAPKQEQKPVETPKPAPKPRVRKPKPAQTQATLPVEKPSEGFAKQVHDYFDSKQIGLLQIISNKKTEFDAIVTVPSPVGTLKYYCKAKAKKTSSEGDLAAALLEAQQHKLPLLYVAGGALTKKATDLLSTQLAGVTVVQPWA